MKTYRPDIDGMRALAILPVLFFHAELCCPGGYVGVDVFFVISGYLITSLLMRDLEAGRFSLADFWERRFRRLLPPICAVLLFSVVAAWFVLLPADFTDFFYYIAAQAAVSANFWCWKGAGYFETASGLKPMLHLWSLSVEEQFYILLPPFLAMVYRRNSRWLPGMIAVLAMTSFALSVYGSYTHPYATYFLLPTRAWEMLAGCLLCFVPAPSGLSRVARESLSATGLAMIVVSAFGYDETTRFPGLLAAVPCGGAALIIWTGQGGANSEFRPGSMTHRVLASPVLQGIGLISYALYLWHWPLLVFVKHLYHTEVPAGVRAGMILLSFVFAVISYYAVEAPIRKRRHLATRRLLMGVSASVLAGQFIAGILIGQSSGFPDRFSQSTIAYAEATGMPRFRHSAEVSEVLSDRLPVLGPAGGKAQCLLWGDSHAMAVVPAFERLADDTGTNCIVATRSGMAPLLDFASGSQEEKGDSEEFNAEVLELIERRKIPNVILAARWRGYQLPDAELLELLRGTVTQIQRTGADVWIMRQVPEYDYDVPRGLARASIAGTEIEQMGLEKAEHVEQNSAVNEVFDSLRPSGARQIDPAEILCIDDGRCLVERDGQSLYRDQHHLSVAGALMIVDVFRPAFELEQPPEIIVD